MTRLALVLVFAVVLAAGLSYYSGLQIERDFHAATKLWSEQPDFPAEVTTTYERGIFRSSAETALRLSASAAPTLTMHHHIAHGPIPWTGLAQGARPGETWIESEVRLSGQHPAIASTFADVPPLRIFTRAGAESGSSRFHWPAFSGTARSGAPGAAGAGGGTVAIQELRGEIEFGGEREEAVGFFEWGGMTLESPLFTVEMAGVGGEFAYEHILRPAIYGQSSFHLDAVRALAGGRAMADLNGLRWAEQRAVEDGKMFLHSTLSLETLSVLGTALREGRLETRFENLDLSVWERVRELARRYAAGARGGAIANAGTPAQPGAAGVGGVDPAEALRLLQTFVAADPSLALDLAAQVDGARVTAQSHARFEPGAATGALDPQTLLGALDAELSLQIPTRLFDAWVDGPRVSGKAAQLRALRDQGLLRRGPGDVYAMQLRMRSGELSINGVPYPAFSTGRPEAGRFH